MRTIRGPGVFLAQFARDEAPFNTIEGLAGWAAGKGFRGVQIPTWDRRVIDLEQAAASQAYCDDFKSIFSKLTGYGFDGWAVLEWECCLKNSEDGAAEGARFIRDHIIEVSTRAFDDFVKSGANRELNRIMIGAEDTR